MRIKFAIAAPFDSVVGVNTNAETITKIQK